MAANVRLDVQQAAQKKEATTETNAEAKTVKNGWDIADVVIKPLGGLFTALAVAGFGYYASVTLDRRAAVDTNTRLYAELMNQREEAETTLRKDMFTSIIGSFLTRKANGSGQQVQQEVLNLELLAYNFHDALDLAPLFKHVYNHISETREAGAENYQTRLERAATEVKDKQIAALEEAGGKLDGVIDLSELKEKNGTGLTVIEDVLPIHPESVDSTDPRLGKTYFKVQVFSADPERSEIEVKLEVRSPNKHSAESSKEVDFLYTDFTISPFDFPMIDNTRLPHGKRCAIVMRKFEQSHVEITLVYFPGSHASLKEKPFYNEVMHDLLYANNVLNAQHPR